MERQRRGRDSTSAKRGWELSPRHFEMRVARWAKLWPPSYWDALSPYDKAEVTVNYMVEGQMEDYERAHPEKRRK